MGTQEQWPCGHLSRRRKGLYQNPTSFVLKVLKKFRIEEIYTKIIKVIHKKSIFGIILSGEICKSFPLELETRQGYSIISLLIQHRTGGLGVKDCYNGKIRTLGKLWKDSLCSGLRTSTVKRFIPSKANHAISIKNISEILNRAKKRKWKNPKFIFEKLTNNKIAKGDGDLERSRALLFLQIAWVQYTALTQQFTTNYSNCRESEGAWKMTECIGSGREGLRVGWVGLYWFFCYCSWFFPPILVWPNEGLSLSEMPARKKVSWLPVNISELTGFHPSL